MGEEEIRALITNENKPSKLLSELSDGQERLKRESWAELVASTYFIGCFHLGADSVHGGPFLQPLLLLLLGFAGLSLEQKDMNL